MDEKYCQEHNTKYYRNEKNGRTWYSHKIQGTDQYCNESKKQTSNTSIPVARDYDSENRGKIRNNIVERLIEKGGTEALREIDRNTELRKLINRVTDYVMTGDEF